MSPTASTANMRGGSIARRCSNIVRAGQGQSGDNAEYVLETYDHLREIGVRDRDLEWLAEKLRAWP